MTVFSDFQSTFVNELIIIICNIIRVVHGIGDWAGIIVNITILATAIYTFIFGVYNPVIYPLRKLLRTLGLSFWESSVIAWKCRSNPVLYVRFYMETAIIHTRGIHANRYKWYNIRNTFSNALTEYKKSGSFTIEVKSVSDILTEEITSLINAYFNLCDLNSGAATYYFWKKYLMRHPEMSPRKFSSYLSISNGYLAPLARIAGINDRFEQNWQRIIDNYTSTMRNSPKATSAGLSLTYTWLMWGPSMEIDVSTSNSAYKSLGIYGCGDEANSIHVIMNDEIRKSLFSGSRLCTPCIIVGQLYNPKYYPKSNFDSLSKAFLDRIHYSCDTSFDYVFDIESVDYRNFTKNSANYFTAYIWAMFCMDNHNHSLAHTIVFFEHVNLADQRNYDYLCKCLLCKIHAYIDQAADGNSYYYLCAMNKDIDSRICAEIEKGMFAGKIEVHPYDKQTILQMIDSHFDMTKYVRIREDKYWQVLKLHYKIHTDNGIDKLCRLLKHPDLIIVGVVDNGGELVGAYSEHPEEPGIKIELLLPDNQEIRGRLKDLYRSTVHADK